MEIKDLISNRANYGSQRNVSNIKYLVIHYTGNDGDTAKANCTYFKNNVVKASAHYFVDDNGVYRSVSDNYVAYSVGASSYKHKYCRNTNSISVELCDCQKNGKYNFTSATISNAIELCKAIIKKYNIPKENVIRHYDVTGKICPKPFVESVSDWNGFKNSLYETTKYKQGDFVEINTPMYFTGAVENNRYLYDTTVEQPWLSEDTKSLIKNDNLLARATYVWDEGDASLVQVFNDQFRIKTKYITRKL